MYGDAEAGICAPWRISDPPRYARIHPDDRPPASYGRWSRLGDAAAAAPGFEAPADDAGRPDPDVRLGSVDRLGPSANLDAAGLPGGEHVVDNDGRPSGDRHVPELLGRREVSTGDEDGVRVGIQAPAHGCDVRHTVAAHGGEPTKSPLPAQVVQLGLSEDSHDGLLSRLPCGSPGCPADRPGGASARARWRSSCLAPSNNFTWCVASKLHAM